MEKNILVIDGLDKSINQINFQKYGIVCVNICDFSKEIIEKYFPHCDSWINSELEIFFEDNRKEKTFCVFSEKHELKNGHDINVLNKVFLFLKLLSTSDFHVVKILTFSFSDNKISPIFKEGLYDVRSYEPFKSIEKENINAIEELLSIILKIETNKFMNIICQNYLQSYLVFHSHLSYLSLIFCLESILPQNEELSYRLRRAVSIIIGTDLETSVIIFENTKKLYNLRSKIVHSGLNESHILKTYMVYLKNLVALLIIELYIHNFKTNEDIDILITKLGFGDKSKLSVNYKELIISNKSLSLLSTKLT